MVLCGFGFYLTGYIFADGFLAGVVRSTYFISSFTIILVKSMYLFLLESLHLQNRIYELPCDLSGSSIVSKLCIAESVGSDGHLSRSVKLEDKDKEPKREMEGVKEKERYREKYWAKSIQELDLSNCERCTPSYRLLPEDV